MGISSIVAGISSEIDPVLVLSGVTEMSDLNLFAYHPFVILGGVYEIPNDDDKNKLTDSELEEAARRVSSISQVTTLQNNSWFDFYLFLCRLLSFKFIDLHVTFS